MTETKLVRSLADVLDPFDPVMFVREHWGRRALHIPGKTDKFASLRLDRETVTGAIQSINEIETPDLVMVGHVNPQGEHRQFRIPPSLAGRLYSSGMTVYLSNAHHFHAETAQLARAMKLALGEAGPIKCGFFLSPEAGGFGLHYDDKHIFLLQIEGSKHWSYSEEPAVEFPRANKLGRLTGALGDIPEGNPDAPRIEPSGLHEVTLQPGDVLYLPAGCWHQGIAQGGASLGLTIGFQPYRFADLLEALVVRGTAECSSWRAFFPASLGHKQCGMASPEILSILAERLRELRQWVGSLQIADLERIWLSTVHNMDLPRSPHKPGSVAVEPQEILSLAPGVCLHTLHVAADEGGELLLYGQNQEMELSSGARPFTEELQRRAAFQAGEAVSWTGSEEEYEWEEIQAILTLLVSKGLLRRTAEAVQS